jgi:class 3 adenylate cyclase
MAHGSDLQVEVAAILRSQWSTRDGTTVPETEDLQLGNDAVKLTGTVLYADIHDSTKLVDGHQDFFAAEVYKAFLHCAAKILRSENGTITAYDGDRVMAVFIGDSKNTSAVRAALKIHYAVGKIVNPAIKTQYPKTEFVLRHTVGIDTSSLFVARTGIRGSNDLVWVGRAANYAAKLTTLPPEYVTRITKDVFANCHESVRLSSGKAMWEEMTWSGFNKMTIYRSNYWWPL